MLSWVCDCCLCCFFPRFFKKAFLPPSQLSWGFVVRELQSVRDEQVLRVRGLQMCVGSCPRREEPRQPLRVGKTRAGRGKLGLVALVKSQRYSLAQPRTTRCPQQFGHRCRVWRWHLSIFFWAGAWQGPAQGQSLALPSATK